MKTTNLVLLFGVGCLIVSLTSAQSERYQSRSRSRSRARPVSLEDDLPADEDAQRGPVVALRRVRPLLPNVQEQRNEAATPRFHIYAAEPQFNEEEADVEDDRRVVVIPQARSDSQFQAVTNDASYQGLYGRQVSRQDDDGSRYRQRPSVDVQSLGVKSARQKETSNRPAPVQTIRNYSKINDDGSFTFGYEAADGSFKEETRGTDCVVRGKYGYVDPDGNKREFTYVSGNPCDPNAVEQEEEDDRKEDDEEENIPRQPIRPLVRTTSRPNVVTHPTTVFQQAYEQPEQAYEPTPVHREPTRLVQQAPRQEIPRARPVIRPLTTTTPRPTPPSVTTYRPTYITNTTPRPETTYNVGTTFPAGLTYTTATPPSVSSAIVTRIRPVQQQSTSSVFDFDAELRKFQLNNNVVAKAPVFQSALTNGAPQTYQQQRPVIRQQFPPPQAVRPVAEPRPVQPARVVTPVRHQQQKTTPAAVTRTENQAQKSGNPIYTSQLVFDPSSGQYNTVLYQPLPKLNGGAEINLSHRLQPYVQPQQQYNPQQFYNPQQYYQSAVPQQQQHGPQQFYYVSPHQRSSLSSGQIDAFLRGQNIQF